jgi:hypothetical protein
MTGAPGLADAGKAMSKARAHLDVAAQGDDPAVKRDRYRQAAQRLGYASRVLDTLATPPPCGGRRAAELRRSPGTQPRPGVRPMSTAAGASTPRGAVTRSIPGPGLLITLSAACAPVAASPPS